MGWGCCCLQVTFQAASFDESVQLYDQLIPLTPIFVNILLSNRRRRIKERFLSLVRIKCCMSSLAWLYK